MVKATIGTDRYKTTLHTSAGDWIADEPESLGGTALGPAPAEFLQLSLASCTAITLRMYADRKNWPVEKIEVEIDLAKDQARTILTRTIHLVGSLNDEQKDRLLAIANACPVHRILTSPIEINTTLQP